ncbi:MAG: type II toxin-antitoxin system prevent-host-death family antitoxin [Acidimicrobiales bacterium]
MTATEVKAKLLSELDEVAAGEEVEIIKRGRPVARLVPSATARVAQGMLDGLAMTADADDDLLSTGEEWETS